MRSEISKFRVIKMRKGIIPGTELKTEKRIVTSVKLKVITFSIVLLIIISISGGCASLHKHKHLRNIPCPCETQFRRTLK